MVAPLAPLYDRGRAIHVAETSREGLLDLPKTTAAESDVVYGDVESAARLLITAREGP